MTKRTAIYEQSSALSHIDIGAGCSHVASKHISLFTDLISPPYPPPTPLNTSNRALGSAFWKQPVCDTLLYLTVPIFWSSHTNFSVHISLTGCCCCRCKQAVIWDTQSFHWGILYASACSLRLLCAQFQSRIVSLQFVIVSCFTLKQAACSVINP